MKDVAEYKENFCFNESDFESFGISPYAVLKIFNKASTAHGELLDVGFNHMLEKKLLWVSMRIKYEILEMPKPNEQLCIITYPSGKNLLEFDRDFLIYNSEHTLLIKGTNKFCLINSVTRRIANLSGVDLPTFQNKKPIFEGRFLKTDTFEPEFLADYTYKIAGDDIDVNGHTNNAAYAHIVSNMLAGSKRKIRFFQINFLKESMLGDRLDMYRKNDGTYVNILGKLAESVPSFSALVEFEK